MEYLLMLLGFVLLIKGADWLVYGAREIAARFGISELIIICAYMPIGIPHGTHHGFNALFIFKRQRFILIKLRIGLV